MGNVRMRAEQINYGATNVKVALDELDPAALIALNERMNKIDAWKDTVKTEEKTGTEVTFTNALALDAVSLSAEIEAEQDLHGYDKPWVGGAGKNIYVGSPSFDGYDNRNLYQLSDETYNGHEVIYRSTAWSGVYKEITVKAGVTYTFSAMVKCAEAASVRIFNKAAETLASETIGTSWTKITATFTPSTDTVERLRVESTTNVTIYLSEYQLEVGSTATSYAPYSNICPISGHTSVTITDYDSESNTASVTIQLGTTVYGGSLNLTTGVLTITHVILVNNTSDMDNSEDYPGWTNSGIRALIGDGINRIITGQIMNCGTAYGANTTGSSGDTLLMPKDYYGGKSQTEWKALAMDVQIAVELAAPQTIQLTPEQLTMLKGYNRLSADTGDITVEAYTGAAWGGDES